LGTSAFSAILSINSFFFMVAPFYGCPLASWRACFVCLPSVIREARVLAIAAFTSGLAE
jgi:hypothetical protein